MTREQNLEAALHQISMKAFRQTDIGENHAAGLSGIRDRHTFLAIRDMANEALATPPDTSWEDRTDELTNAIYKAHPHITKDFATYTKALELVSNRHSKSALVGLVNYLLSQVPAPDTRVVSVSDMDRIIDKMNITVSLAHALDDGGVNDEYEDILRAELDALNFGIGEYSKLRAIIEGKDQ